MSRDPRLEAAPDPAQSHNALRRADVRPLDTRVPEGPTRIEQAFWTFFLFAAIGGFSRDHPGIERLTWLAADAFALYLIARHPKLYGALVWRTLPFLLWGALAIVSALWSLTPGISAYHGAQLVLTILVGVVIAARLGLERMIRLIVVACGVALGLSVIEVAMGAPRTVAVTGEWLGIFTHKNVLGFVGVLFMFSAGTLAMQSRWPVAYVAAAAIGFAMVAASESGTSIVAAIGLATLLVGQTIYRRGNAAVALALGIGIATLAAAGLVVIAAELRLLELFFDATGKDPTLTGRTVLWDFGIDAFWDRPLLGHGFKAYWESELTTVAYLQFVMQQGLWFFHNNAIEVMVAFGIVGLALFAATLVVAYARIIAMFVQAPTPGAAWCLCLAAHVLVMMTAENPLVSNHSIPQTLFVSAFLFATLRRTVHAAPAPLAAGGAPHHA